MSEQVVRQRQSLSVGPLIPNQLANALRLCVTGSVGIDARRSRNKFFLESNRMTHQYPSSELTPTYEPFRQPYQ